MPVAGAGVILSFALTVVISLIGPKNHPVNLPAMKADA
jgi:hypothetical protein